MENQAHLETKIKSLREQITQASTEGDHNKVAFLLVVLRDTSCELVNSRSRSGRLFM